MRRALEREVRFILGRQVLCPIIYAELDVDGDAALIEVPQFDGDVHDVEGLLRVREFLFADPRTHARLLADLAS